MTVVADKKPVITPDKKLTESTLPMANDATSVPVAASNDNAAQAATEKFRETIKSVDAERTELVKNAIDNIKPGRTFDSSVVRQINKLETKRNRMIVTHFAWLLKNSPASVHAIVHQIIEL